MNDIPVTILMPAYNAGKYIHEAIRSVLQQSYPHFELLIVNDGSTDDTEEIICSFDDPRIVLINQPNLGVSGALNRGLRHARSRYIARFDADDICIPTRIERQYGFMLSHPEYVLTGGNAEYIDMDGEHIFHLRSLAYTDKEIRALPVESCPFLHVAVMYKKQSVLDSGGYNEHAHTFEDHLLWTRMLDRGKVCNLDETLVKVRFNPESVTIDEKWRGPRFMALKYAAIKKGCITPEDGDKLLKIVRKQDTARIKKGSYYALLAKKYLWNNYDPRRARKHIHELRKVYPGKADAYVLWLLSFLPRTLVQKIYRTLNRLEKAILSLSPVSK